MYKGLPKNVDRTKNDTVVKKRIHRISKSPKTSINWKKTGRGKVQTGTQSWEERSLKKVNSVGFCKQGFATKPRSVKFRGGQIALSTLRTLQTRTTVHKKKKQQEENSGSAILTVRTRTPCVHHCTHCGEN
ncbi:hypothetical protein NFI96_025385 [Prochilodus magdalenae]|nr:hypothetical protein NFI96_025385 [Prochilodus magdalenae]